MFTIHQANSGLGTTIDIILEQSWSDNLYQTSEKQLGESDTTGLGPTKPFPLDHLPGMVVKYNLFELVG